MKLICLLFTALISLSIKAQEAKTMQKILIGFNFSPDYQYRTLKNNDGSASGDLVIKSRNDIEIAKLGFTTGLNIYFNCSKNVGVETGIQYSNKGYKIKNQHLTWENPAPGLATKATTIYSCQYIGIPLKAKFFVGKTNLRFISSVGFMTNFLLNVKQNITLEYDNGSTEEKTQSTTSGFNKVDISPMVSVGIDYKLNEKIHLTAEPTFRYGLIKTKDAPVSENLWNAGVNMGLYYSIK